MKEFYKSPWLLPHFFATVLGIFMICVLIDLFRVKIVSLGKKVITSF